MKNLTQIKSGQLEKLINKQVIAKTTSIYNLDQEVQINHYPLLKRSPNYQNHYQISNVVKQILEMKPRTAAKISESSSRNHKTQNVADFKPNLQFFTNKYKRNDRNYEGSKDNVEEHYYKNSLSKQKICVNYEGKKPQSNKVLGSKSSRALRRQVNLADKGNYCRIRKSKRKTQFSAPKSKITIQNIDSTVDIQPKRTVSRGKPTHLYDLNLPKPNLIVKDFKEDQIVNIKSWNQKKPKKSLTDAKIPQFIKASLQMYQQEPTFLIEELQKRKKRQSYAQRQEITKTIQQDQIQRQQQQQSYQQKQMALEEQEILANKIKLVEKQKRKSVLHIEPSQEITQEEIGDRYEKKAYKSKKREKLQQKINICGWQQQNEPKTVYFQF